MTNSQPFDIFRQLPITPAVSSHQEDLDQLILSGLNSFRFNQPDTKNLSGDNMTSSANDIELDHPLSESKGRMRVSRACDRCRTQKIKCSGTYPCTTCTKHKRECVYNTNSQLLNKQADSLFTPTILNVHNERELPFLSRNDDKVYIKHLENRIQYLEGRLNTDKQQLTQPPNDGETESESTLNYCRPSSKWRYSKRGHLYLIQEFCTNIHNELTQEDQRKISFPRQQYFGWNLSGSHYLSSDPMPTLPQVELPESIDYYIDYFFTDINPLFAIIHEPVFRQQLQTYNQTINSIGKDPDSPQQVKLFEAMFYLIVVLAIRFSEFEKKKDFCLDTLVSEEILFKFCHKVVTTLSFQWESFELVQCWLLITLYLRVSHRQSSYFLALGQAVTMCRSMGIGKVPRVTVKLGTSYEQLKSKRIFWALYVFDRLFGLQSGRFQLLYDEDIGIEFPSLDFKSESAQDNWITLPSLALIHIAKLSTFVLNHGLQAVDILKYQQINKQLIELNKWLNENGFNNDDLFKDPSEKISSMAKAQVKLHYYDLVLCIHGNVLFNFVGRRIASPGLKIEMVLDSCTNILQVLSKIHKANRFYAPWYLNLLLLFNVGINSLILINTGLYLSVAKPNYSKTIELLTVLKKANVKTPDGKTLIKKRFKMAAECLWALNTSAKLLSLRFQQDLKSLQSIGTEPGSPDVNKATFTQYGFFKEQFDTENNPRNRDEISELMRTGKRRKYVPQDEKNNKRHLRSNYSTAGSRGVDQESNRDGSGNSSGANDFDISGDINGIRQPSNSMGPSEDKYNDSGSMSNTVGSTASEDISDFNEFNPNDPSFVNRDSELYNNLLWFDQEFGTDGLDGFFTQSLMDDPTNINPQ